VLDSKNDFQETVFFYGCKNDLFQIGINIDLGTPRCQEKIARFGRNL
jgi:hypothetical protein